MNVVQRGLAPWRGRHAAEPLYLEPPLAAGRLSRVSRVLAVAPGRR